MGKVINIKREIDRYRGNKMLFSRIKQGAYSLRTGEPMGDRTMMSAEEGKKEVDEFIDRIDEEEELELSRAEKVNNARTLKNQISEGRKNLTLRFHDKLK